jgi:hypothetical protein
MDTSKSPRAEMSEPLLVSTPHPVTRGRYWILSVYTINAALQCCTWSLPGNTPNTMRLVYGLSDSSNHLLINYGPAAYLLFALPCSWLMDRTGVRVATALNVCLLLLASVSRCFANDDSLQSLIILHASFVINGIAGPIACVRSSVCISCIRSHIVHMFCRHVIYASQLAPSSISAGSLSLSISCESSDLAQSLPSKIATEWFAPDERTTATCIATLGNQSGCLFLYVAVAFVCPDDASVSLSDATQEQLLLNKGFAVVSIVNLLMMLVYFPAHPPHPPSASADLAREAEERVTLRSIIKDSGKLLVSVPFMVLMVSYAVIAGLGNVSGALVTMNLAPLDGASQSVGAWVSFSFSAVGSVVGLVLSALTDRFKTTEGMLKNTIVHTTLAGGLGYLGYCLCLSNFVPVLNWGPWGLYLTAFFCVLNGALTCARYILLACVKSFVCLVV